MFESLIRGCNRKDHRQPARHLSFQPTSEPLEDRVLLSTAPWVEQAKLTASDAAALDHFGLSVSVSGDTVVVGARAFGGAAGNAYVFQRVGDVWTEQAKLTASDAAADDRFGRRVAISGDTVVVGAYGNDDAGSYSGSAYVFQRVGDVWTEQAKLTASDAAADDRFGLSVSISGDTIVVGAVGDDDASSNSGSAYVFQRVGAIWTEQAKLTASDAAGGDTFGYSVSISGNTIVVGAVSDSDAGLQSGSAYVFQRVGDVWTERAKLTASDAAARDLFGRCVSVSDDTVVVGAYGNDDAGSYSGSAYVFQRVGDVWTEQAKLTASDAAADDYFGWAVSVSGDTVVAGAEADDDAGLQSGSAYVFQRVGDVWTEQAKLTASDAAAYDVFGYSVSISENTIAVGAYRDGDAGLQSGSAYVFVPKANHAPDAPGDSDPAANEVAPGAANGTAVGITAFANDPDGDTLTYTLTDDAGGRFAIDSGTGDVTVADGALLDYLSATSHTITVQASDGAGGSSTVDFTINVVLQDVTALVEVDYQRSVFNRRTGQQEIDVLVTNISADVLEEPLVFVISSISVPSVTLANPSGQTSDGSPFVDLSGQIDGDGVLSPGEATTATTVIFDNPSRSRFTFRADMLMGSVVSPFLVAGGPAIGQVDAGVLSAQDLQPLLEEATAHWMASGVEAELLTALGEINTYIRDLPGSQLALASSDAIWVDQDAAGFGWFIDPDPADLLFGGSGRVDLFSVITHEIGHVLSFDHEEMGAGDRLSVGARKLPLLVVNAGDANQDGVFNRLDIIQILETGKYRTGQSAIWNDGDWTGDGLFDQLDIVVALQTDRYLDILDGDRWAAELDTIFREIGLAPFEPGPRL